MISRNSYDYIIVNVMSVTSILNNVLTKRYTHIIIQNKFIVKLYNEFFFISGYKKKSLNTVKHG